MAVTRSSARSRTAGTDDRDPGPAPRTVDPGPLVQSRLALGILVAAVVVPIVVMAVSAARQPWLPTSDDALILIRALDVPSHLPLTGTYSRYGFDHPGPLLFYAMAAPSHVLGPTGMLLACGLINAAAAGGSCYVAWRRGGVVLTTVTAVVLLLFVHAMGEAVVSVWNPWVAVLPYFLSVLLAWGVSQRDWRLLPWLMLSAGYAAQAHVSYAPFAALLVLGSLGWALVAWRRSGVDGRGKPRVRPSGRVLVVSAAVLALVWLPPFVQQVSSDDGNLAKLASHFLSDHSDEPAGPFTDRTLPDQREVLGIIAREFGSLPPWTGAAEEVEPFTSNVTGANLLLLPAPFLAFAVVLALAWRRRVGDAAALQSIALGLSIVSMVAMSRVTGGLAPYIVRFTWVPASLMALSTCWSICRLLGAPAAAPGAVVRPARSRMPRATSAAAIAVVLLATVVGVSLVRVPLPNAAASDLVLHVIDATQASLPPGKEVRVAGAGDEALTAMGGVEAELLRRGVPISADPQLASRYDASHRGTDPRPAVVTVVAGPSEQPFAPAPTQRFVTAHDPLSTDERREYESIRTKVVANYGAIFKGEPLPYDIPDTEKARYTELGARGPAVQIYLDPGA